MNVARGKTVLKELAEQNDGYVDAPASERVSFIWELTSEIWSLKEKGSAEQRLQRDVTNLIRQRS